MCVNLAAKTNYQIRMWFILVLGEALTAYCAVNLHLAMPYHDEEI